MYVNNEHVKETHFRLFFWSVFAVFFIFLPSLIIAPIILFLLAPIKIEKSDISFICVYLGLFMAVLGSAYERTNNTGDISKYIASFDMLNTDGLFLLSKDNLYVFFYPSWYMLNAIVKDLGLPFKYVTFSCVFIAYICSYLAAKNLMSKLRDALLVIVFISLFFSIPIIFSSYRTFTALSCLFLGIVYLQKNKGVGFAFILLGVGFHPITIVPLVLYIISKYLTPAKGWLIAALAIGVFVKPLLIAVSGLLLNIPFLGGKVESYINGEWANYRFHEAGEYLTFLQLIIFAVTLVYILFSANKFSYKILFKSRLLKFSFFYFCFVIMFFSFRTIFVRLLLSGVVFLIPIIFYALKQHGLAKKALISFLLILCLDTRTFMFFSYDSYKVGAGFPNNIVEPHFINLIFKSKYD